MKLKVQENGSESEGSILYQKVKLYLIIIRISIMRLTTQVKNGELEKWVSME